MQGGEWLELRVGRNNIPCKKKVIFSCNFCRRKFRSSQALGGHQNAHRRERSLLGHVSRNNMIMPRSLWVQPHSEPASVFGAEGGSGTGQMGVPSFSVEEGPALVWPGSVRSVPDSDSCDILDLNLKL